MTRRDNAAFRRTLRQHGQRDKLPAALPVVHASTVWAAGEIAHDGRILVRRCDVFERELAFFFVMRPGYRSKFAAEPSHQISRFPIAFVLEPNDLPNPVQVYPFDTGGAAKGAFKDQADPQIPLEDYALQETMEAAAGHIEWAFGTAENYMNGEVRHDLLEGVPEHDQVTRGYADIARMGRKGSNDFDRRSSAIEIAFGQDIELNGRKGLAILPRQLLDDKPLIDRFEAFGLKVEVYDWRPNTLPDEYEDDIFDLAKAWYVAEGWIK